ncbi:hypothetical protein SAY87_017078 [Trapa incisa]|uniref:GDSL esterase/lipase n=1 Tax=Trapa incisa TaxID=236973 RepID=A0AAN7L744_9MYRT|nr:hypothetical protein SAY87_017078 [Trapa incisa]
MLRKAVYLFSIGGNDYLIYYQHTVGEGDVPTQSEQLHFVKQVVGNMTNAIMEIYEQGVRKIAFQNVGPMGCLPLVETMYPNLNGSCARELLSMARLHNEQLYAALSDLTGRLEGFRFSLMDYFSSLYERVMDPSNFGFDVGMTECYTSTESDAYGGYGSTLCEYPSAYVFFDDAHTTQTANAQLAELIWRGDLWVTGPYNIYSSIIYSSTNHIKNIRVTSHNDPHDQKPLIGIAAGECREGHCFVGDEGFPGRNARPLMSGKYAAGGRKSASMDELLKVSIFEYCRFFIDMISRKNPFTRKQVHVGQPTTSSIDHNVLFVFGDSLFDGGNGMIHNDANYSIGHYPYGYTYFSSASGRVCDGRIVPDFIGEYANLPLIPASLQHGTSFYFGANFACAGSVVLDSDNTNKTVITLNGQLAMFKQMVQEFNQTLGPDGLREMLGKAVYLFSIGGVDYINYYAAKFNGNGSFPTEAEKREFVHELVGNTTNAIIDVYEQGGRKFTFQNVGPIDCLPRVVVDYPKFNGSCVPELLFMPMLHNEELYGGLTDLAERLEGFKLSFFDYFSTLYDRIMNPSVSRWGGHLATTTGLCVNIQARMCSSIQAT